MTEDSQISRAWFSSLLVSVGVALVVWLTYSLTPALPPVDAGYGAALPHISRHGTLPGKPITLPRRLCPVNGRVCYAHYEFSIAPEQIDNKSQALFFPGSFGALGVVWNGVWLTPEHNLQPPIRRVMFDPQLVSVARQAIDARAGANHSLRVIVGTPPDVYDWLAPFYLGAAASLGPSWQLSRFLAQDILVVGNGIYLILALFALLSYRLAGSDPLFLWFALLATCALFRNLFFVWVDPELLFPMAVVYHASTNLLALASLAFVCTLVGAGSQKWLATMAALGIPITMAAIGVLIYIPLWGEMYANNITQLVVASATLVTMYQLLQYFGAPWNAVKSWTLACFIGATLFVAHDIISIGVLHKNVPAQLSSLSPLMVVVAFCILLANRLGSAVKRTRDHNLLLENAVREREQDLYVAYAQLREAERQKTVKGERRRMMRDLHDGVGGQLASLAITARRTASTEIAGKIEESLADLRAVVDYVDDDRTASVAEFLQEFRNRITPWIELHELQHVWSGDAWRCEWPVDASWRLHTSRILQEGIANVVRHAHATRLSIAVNTDDQALTIELTDNGQGIDLDPAAKTANSDRHCNRGISNMQSRSAELGGHLKIAHASTGGTRISIYLRLPRIPSTA